jgi:hypothetical protein
MTILRSRAANKSCLEAPEAVWMSLTDMIEGIFLKSGLSGGDILDVEQGLAGELGDHGVGMAEQEDQQTKPAEFARFNSDYGNGFCHLRNLSVAFRPAF